MKYEIKELSLKKYFCRGFLSQIGAVLVFMYFMEGVDFVFLLICSTAIATIPTAMYLKLHYNHFSYSVSSFIHEGGQFTFFRNEEFLKVSHTDIQSLTVHITPNKKNNRLPFLEWESYYVVVVRTNSDQKVILSSLLGETILNLFLSYPAKYKTTLYPFINKQVRNDSYFL